MQYSVYTGLFRCLNRLLSAIPVLLTAVAPAIGQPLPTEITLPQLQQQAAEAAVEVFVARRDLETARLDQTAFAARLKPRLDLVANLPNYFRTSTEVVLDNGEVAFRRIEQNNSFVGLQASQRIAATGGTVSLQTRLQRTDNFAGDSKSYNGAPVRLFYQQPIFAFNPFKWDRQLLPLQTAVADRAYIAARVEARLIATARFFDLVSADQERRIAETNRAANETLFTIARERFDLGKINRGDLVQLELELTSAQQNLLRAERLVRMASAAIYQLLGTPYDDTLLVPALPTAETAAFTIEPERALQRLRAQRPELLDARRRVLEAERETERIRKALGPRLDLQAGFGLVRGASEIAPIYTDPQSELIVSLNVSVPLLDWGERKALTERARLDSRLANEIGQRTATNLETELLQLLQQWPLVQEELALSTRIRDLAIERFRISQESYQLGAIPLTELTLAQQFRDQNTRRYADSLRAYWLTYIGIQRLIGELPPD